MENAGWRYSQLAIQGPRAKEVLQQLTPVALRSAPAIACFIFWGPVRGVDCLIARTGYTGEDDGFEIYFPPILGPAAERPAGPRANRLA